MNETYSNLYEFIQECVNEDIRINKKRTGKDFSSEVGTVLMGYVVLADDYAAILAQGANVSVLEKQLSEMTGKEVSFSETRRCGPAIHELHRSDPKNSQDRLTDYVDSLFKAR